MKRTFLTICVTTLVLGCGGSPEPLTAHGKPVAYWLAELKQPDAKSRKKAVTALGHVATADPAAIPALISAVKDRDAGVRNQAVAALLNIGPAAKDAVPALTEAQSDGDAEVRALAAKALTRIQGSS